MTESSYVCSNISDDTYERESRFPACIIKNHSDTVDPIRISCLSTVKLCSSHFQSRSNNFYTVFCVRSTSVVRSWCTAILDFTSALWPLWCATLRSLHCKAYSRECHFDICFVLVLVRKTVRSRNFPAAEMKCKMVR